VVPVSLGPGDLDLSIPRPEIGLADINGVSLFWPGLRLNRWGAIGGVVESACTCNVDAEPVGTKVSVGPCVAVSPERSTPLG